MTILYNLSLEAALQATLSFLLWIKFIYFFRVFQSIGFLIRIIIEVVVGMKNFLLTIMAFGDAMRSISFYESEEDQFIPDFIHLFTYVYRILLGDFCNNDFASN